MQVTLTHKLTVLATTLAVAFGMAFTTYAAFDDLEIEVKVYEDMVEVEVEYDDEDEDYTYEDMDLDEAYDELVKDLKDDFDLEITTDDIEDIAEVEHEDDEAEAEEDAADAIRDAEDAIADAADRIEDAEEAEVDEDDLKAASTTLAKAQEKLDAAEDEYEDEDYAAAEDLADAAKKLAEGIFEVEDNDDDEDDDRDFCERTKQAAGWGVAKKCVDDEDYELNDKMVKKVERFEDRNMEKYREYGKSTDKTELQNQLRELLLVLVQLLTKQMELQDN